jgi:hypothetical protein
VKVDKIFAGQASEKCNGSWDSLSEQVNTYPVFGCNGRCGSNTTEDMGFSVSWPYMRTDMSYPLASIGASSNGYITNGSGTNLGTICTKLTYVAPGAACK